MHVSFASSDESLTSKSHSRTALSGSRVHDSSLASNPGRPSHATKHTPAPWVSNSARRSKSLRTSHTMTLLSPPAVASSEPSAEKARNHTSFSWPPSARYGWSGKSRRPHEWSTYNDTGTAELWYRQRLVHCRLAWWSRSLSRFSGIMMVGLMHSGDG